MIRYAARRLLWAIPTVFGVLLITFALYCIAGGNVVIEIAGQNATHQTIQEIRQQLGLDKPLLLSWDSQFVNHLKNALTLDFGRARDGEMIAKKITRGLPASLSLTVPILAGTLVISVAVSLLLGALRGSKWDLFAVVVCVAAMSAPYLGFILLGQYFLAYRQGLFPVFFSPQLSTCRNVALPVIIGITAGLGKNVRFYRTVILEQLCADYVQTALAKGLSMPQVLIRHVLKNIMPPLITQVSQAIPTLVLGSLLLERFFGIPGLGYLMVEAVSSRDWPVINAMTFILALLVVVFNLAADICYAIVDPRVRLE